MAAAMDEYTRAIGEAQAALAAGDKDLAYEQYARATEIDPNKAEAWQGRAAVSRNEDDVVVSLAYAAALQPGDDDALALADHAAQLRAASAAAGDAGALADAGKKLAEAGLAEQARRLLARSVELDAGQADGWVWLAALTGESAESESALRHALAVDDHNPIARAGLAAVIRDRERAPARERIQETAPVADASAPVPSAPLGQVVDEFIGEGQTAEAAGDQPRAHQMFSVAAELAPANEQAWLGKSRSAETVDEKITCLEKVIELNPNNPEALQSLTAYRMQQLRSPAQSVPTTDRTIVGRKDARPARRVNPFKIVVVLLVALMLVFMFLAMLIWFRF